MSFGTKTATGSTVGLALGDKFTVFGQELIVNGIGAHMAGWPGAFPLDYPTSLSLERFDQLNASTWAPEYLAPVTVSAQIVSDTEERDSLLEPDDGPLMPKTYKVLYLQETDISQGYPLVRLVLRDKARGLMYGGLFLVEIVPYTVSGGDAAAEIPRSVTDGTARALTCIKVAIKELVTVSGGIYERASDAHIVFPLQEASQAELLQAWIDITPLGGTKTRYRLINADGLGIEQTHHWCAQLERVRP